MAIFAFMITNLQDIIISHINDNGKIQSNDSHQQGVAELAYKFGNGFGGGDIARITGLLHDKGKEQNDWQKYIQGVTGCNKEYAHIKSGPHHAYVGACIAQKQYPQIAPFIAQTIARHLRTLYVTNYKLIHYEDTCAF